MVYHIFITTDFRQRNCNKNIVVFTQLKMAVGENE